jgi:hypothetical protein
VTGGIFDDVKLEAYGGICKWFRKLVSISSLDGAVSKVENLCFSLIFADYPADVADNKKLIFKCLRKFAVDLRISARKRKNF